MTKNKMMMYFFVASEAFFFLALIIAYVYYSHPGGKLSDTARFLDVKKTAIFTLFLLSSSVTINVADNRLKKGNHKGMVGWMVATIILGLVFLIGQSLEYAHLFEIDITINKNVFGSAFFTLTGFHGLHVLIGLIVLSIIAYLIYKDKFNKLGTSALESASIYWHFVDAVWIVVFSVVYIGSII
ncbi:MAG TPA: heme-copper oxidase subunit III [Bacteroidales bacterium]|nr:heme-copper oxidase subunit III [Bacteroidales bacterium]